MNILISACLLGINCKYNETSNENDMPKDKLTTLKSMVTLIPFCPEIYGGLEIPRNPCEIQNGRVINSLGEDKTAQYIKGANETLKIARMFNCNFALLKERSPSCGSKTIYDGTFSHTERHGLGITAELLIDNNIKVFGESEIDDLLENIKIAKSPTQLRFSF